MGKIRKWVGGALDFGHLGHFGQCHQTNSGGFLWICDILISEDDNFFSDAGESWMVHVQVAHIIQIANGLLRT